MKEVNFVTPVMYGQQIPDSISSRVIKYRQGDLIEVDQSVLPRIVEKLPLGMVIDLPLTNIQDYKTKFLSWLPIRSDETLASQLHAVMKRANGQVNQPLFEGRQVNLLATQLFLEADQDI